MKLKPSIMFREASYEQLARTEALIDHLDIMVIEWLLKWTEGTYSVWSADFDLDYFEKKLLLAGTSSMGIPWGVSLFSRARNQRTIMKHAKSRGQPWMLVILAAVFLLGFAGGLLTGHYTQPHPHASVVAPQHPHPAPEPPHHHKVPHATYTVRAGDTLWSIAQHEYHNPLKWGQLYHINVKVIGGNPNLILIGTVLQLYAGP